MSAIDKMSSHGPTHYAQADKTDFCHIALIYIICAWFNYPRG